MNAYQSHIAEKSSEPTPRFRVPGAPGIAWYQLVSESDGNHTTCLIVCVSARLATEFEFV